MTKNILITGASSGLGEALSQAYAGPAVTLHLSGRHEHRLAAVAGACEAKGAKVVASVVDVTDQAAMADLVAAAEASGPLDLLIANAGISGGTGGHQGETAEQTLSIFSVNLVGVLNTVLPVIEPMRARRRGQIAIMASLAGFRGLPTAPAYCASKAAVRVWGEGLRGWLARDGIGVTVICPGFVISRMTAANRFRMPFLMTAEHAASIMKRGIDANRARVAYPWPMATLAWLAAALPPAWTDPWLTSLPAKR
jgi:short-subunit dehydrogenase